MRIHIYAIYDKKVKVYGTPFFYTDDISATRSFLRLKADPQSFLHSFPDDYDLYRIGTYDDQDAKMVSLQPTELIQTNTTEPKND